MVAFRPVASGVGTCLDTGEGENLSGPWAFLLASFQMKKNIELTMFTDMDCTLRIPGRWAMLTPSTGGAHPPLEGLGNPRYSWMAFPDHRVLHLEVRLPCTHQ